MIFIGIILIWAVLAKLFEKPKNYYIQKHNYKFKNDCDYEYYVMWCHSMGEIPMDKKSVIQEVEQKENQIKNLLK